MNIKVVGVALLFGVLLFISAHDTNAQLLEDRNKLKTENRRTKGFSLYKKKVIKRSPSGQTQTDDKQVAPKYSQAGGIAKTKKVKIKYSKKDKKRRYRTVFPKYSSDVAGQFEGRAVAPRYSRPRKAGKVRIISPKYSIDVAGKGTDRAVYPKYSKDVAGQGADRAVYPKYSKDVAGQGSDRAVYPKYSKDVAGQGADRAVSPRYSRDIAGQGYKKFRGPRYSKDIAGQGTDYVVVPRYSKYVAGQGFGYQPKNNSASGTMVFEFPKKLYQKGRKRNSNGESDWAGPTVILPKKQYKDGRKWNSHGESEWFGPEVKIIDHKRSEFASYTGKFQKHKKGKKMHPSANYLFAKYNNSRFARNTMQKASILWVRVHMNQSDPKGVRKKSQKLKFDKDESEIWNNEEREYIKN